MQTDISLLLCTRAKSPKPSSPARFINSRTSFGPYHLKARFDVEGDPRIYDSAKLLTLACYRNEHEPDCIENKILDKQALHRSTGNLGNALLRAAKEVFPSLDFPYLDDTVTCITLKTAKGRLIATVTEDTNEIKSYLPVPSHLSHILTVLITELESIVGVYPAVDRVKWRGQTYAFKITRTRLQGTIRELTLLDKLSNSPSIINLEAIVVNQDKKIRGFLTPFMRAGNLEGIFKRAREMQGLADDADSPALDWTLKFSWACQISHGVVALHSISAYNGDLKPENVLVDPTGHAILIDFLPAGISMDFAAPEVLAKWDEEGSTLESVLTAPADVYSLGLMLWALAEEKPMTIRPLVWRDGQTPSWYKDIVQRCLVVDPESRPSAAEVLSLLEVGGDAQDQSVGLTLHSPLRGIDLLMLRLRVS